MALLQANGFTAPRWLQTCLLCLVILIGATSIRNVFNVQDDQPHLDIAANKDQPVACTGDLCVSSEQSAMKASGKSFAVLKSQSKIAKISMLFGEPNPLIEDAMSSHMRHASLHDYPVHILRQEVLAGYWSKPSYIISTLVHELEKDPADRLEWLLWFDADSLILNPRMRVETYLPPNDPAFDDIRLLVTKDWNGLNSGIFFIRVHEWSVRLMAKTLTYSMFRPEVDLGVSADQKAMEILINETDFRANTIYVPKTWINANVFDCEKGDLLVHFPGMEHRDWYMETWLNRINGPEAGEWSIDVSDTKIPNAVTEFWERTKRCRMLLQQAKTWLEDVEVRQSVPASVQEQVVWLEEVCSYATDETEMVERAMESVQAAMNHVV